MSDIIKIDPKTVIGLYEGPFKYNPECQIVFDNNHTPITEICGWGGIQKLDHTALVMNAIGEQIAKAMTEHWTISNK